MGAAHGRGDQRFVLSNEVGGVTNMSLADLVLKRLSRLTPDD
jgi:hypothetical protein